MDIIQAVKNFVARECRKPESKYGSEPFIFHFVPVAKYAGKLARELGADEEIVVLSAWLHDIGSIVSGRGDHHLTSAKIAEVKLQELDYPIDKIKLVKKCILNHRGSQRNKRKSLEEKILADADALSNFESIAGIFKAAFTYENLDQGAAKKSVMQKLENKWQKLHFASSKKIIRPRYAAAKILLK
jgi:uncharacterized protein